MSRGKKPVQSLLEMRVSQNVLKVFALWTPEAAYKLRKYVSPFRPGPGEAERSTDFQTVGIVLGALANTDRNIKISTSVLGHQELVTLDAWCDIMLLTDGATLMNMINDTSLDYRLRAVVSFIMQEGLPWISPMTTSKNSG
jgi:hypothetical protein